MFINFSNIPGHQNLFLDYLYNFKNVKRFYENGFRESKYYFEHFSKLSATENINQGQVAEIIKEQYAGLGLSEKTNKNLDRLKQDNTLAIVTGQQLGILGGSLYTFYKIITAIKLSEALKEKFHNYNFVPVFWLEADDHDFDEVRSAHILDDNNEIISLSYDDGVPEEINRGSVGNIKFNSNLSSVFKELNKALRQTEFKPKLIEILTSFYKEGKTFKEAFKKLIFYFFDEYGLVIFDPTDKRIKNILKPIFKKEIEDFREHSNEVVKISAELEETYHAQVKARPINLFLSEEDGRFLIEPGENEFRLRHKRRKFSKETILEMIETSPEKFSPNVLLRPICQDYLFKTACYVGGPSEISYFAQVSPLYKFFNVAQPIIYPRSSFTIVEKNISKIIEKFNMGYVDFFADKEAITKKIIGTLSEIDVEQTFTNSSNELTILLDNLKEKLFAVDNTLVDLTNKTLERILHNIETLKGKAQEAQKKKHEVTIRQLNRVSNLLFPNSNLQERELNFIYFANKYGLNIVQWMFNEIEIDKFEHQLTEIPFS
jgi:bacillithiol biosynthesis cysteine-adding enzyme BshC